MRPTSTLQREYAECRRSGPLFWAIPVIVVLLAFLIISPVRAESFTLNLKDADISALIDTVSELTGKNFVVDPRVKGKVTVVSAHPMAKDEIYQVFLSILEVHGFSTIPTGNVIKIVPEVKAKQTNIPFDAGDQGVPADQMVTRVIQVRNVSATQLVPILRPLIPQQGHMAAYPSTNVLIVSDRASNVDRMVRIIGSIDQATDSGVDVVPLKHASATEVVRILTTLQQKNAAAAQGAPVDAEAQIAADERTNSVLLSGEKSARLRMRAIIAHLDDKQESVGNTHVVYLNYAKAKDLVPVLTGVGATIDGEGNNAAGGAAPPASTNAGIRSPIDIQADETSNALVITAAPDVFRSLQNVIAQLDVRRAQVLVEAIIAEVNMNLTKQLGVDWVVDGTPGGDGPVGIVNFGGINELLGVASSVQTGGVPTTLSSGSLLGFGKFNSSSVNFAALIRALASDGSTNILSTPSLMTLDNQEAEIVIGQNVPFVTGEFSNSGSTTNSVNPFRTIQREDVGLTLRVTPQINEGNSVKLDIEQEISSLSAAASAVAASDIITNKRTIKTTVMVEDGNTLVLGGLMQEDLQQTNQKVPLLGDVPIMGNLFKSKSASKSKTNLMVFLRPQIVRDAATETAVTGGKYRYLRAQQMETRQRGVNLLPAQEAPVMPERFIDMPSPFEQLDELTR